ncbi:conserved hypothetical protein [Burkholderia cenocepacia]|nr:conserved hypothetical protein [Burkholderia cenocepacia]SOT38719.1 hypothetical protein F01_140213 [Burkholderia cenocepacia]
MRRNHVKSRLGPEKGPQPREEDAYYPLKARLHEAIGSNLSLEWQKTASTSTGCTTTSTTRTSKWRSGRAIARAPRTS